MLTDDGNCLPNTQMKVKKNNKQTKKKQEMVCDEFWDPNEGAGTVYCSIHFHETPIYVTRCH